MTSSLLTLTLAASLTIGQGGGKTGKPKTKKTPAKTAAAKLVKTPAMEKIETDTGGSVLVNEPADGMVTVSVSGSKVTDAVLGEIAKIKELDELLVGSGSITDKGVARIASATKLRRLFLLKNTKLTKGCIDDVASLPNLVTLQMSQVDLDKDSLKKLASMKPLRFLLLNTAGIEDDDLEAFIGNKKLKTLNLAGNEDIKGNGLDHLSKMKQLEFVDVVGTRASSFQIDDLSKAIKALGGKVEIRGIGGPGGLAKVRPPKPTSTP